MKGDGRMDNQPVTTRRAILIQDFDDGTYGERLFTGDRTPDTREKAARLKTGRLYPIPDDANIYAVVLTDGTCASSPTRPEADGGLVTFGLFDGGAMTVPLDFIRYVRVMPRVDDREAFEWPSTEKEGEGIER